MNGINSAKAYHRLGEGISVIEIGIEIKRRQNKNLIFVGAAWLCLFASPTLAIATEREELGRVEDPYEVDADDKWLAKAEKLLEGINEIRIQQGLASQKRVIIPLSANNLKEVKITADRTLIIELLNPHGTIESLEWGFYSLKDMLALSESIRTNRVKALEVQSHEVSGEGIVPCKKTCKIHGWLMRTE